MGNHIKSAKIVPFPSATAVTHNTFAARIWGPVIANTPPSGTPHAARSPRGDGPAQQPGGGCMTNATQKCAPPGMPGSMAGATAKGLVPADVVTVTSTHTRSTPSSDTVSSAGWELCEEPHGPSACA